MSERCGCHPNPPGEIAYGHHNQVENGEVATHMGDTIVDTDVGPRCRDPHLSHIYGMKCVVRCEYPFKEWSHPNPPGEMAYSHLNQVEDEEVAAQMRDHRSRHRCGPTQIYHLWTKTCGKVGIPL